MDMGVTFKECTFNCDGKALLVYANVLDNNTNKQTVHITDCVFNDNGNNTVTERRQLRLVIPILLLNYTIYSLVIQQ